MFQLRSICVFVAVGAGASSGAFQTLTVDDRDVDVWVPECAQPNAPIILSLHAWATSKDMEKSVDRLPDYAGSECAVIAYPQGKNRGELFGLVGFSWNAGGCCPNANTAKTDDVTFLDHVITAVAEEFNANEQLVLAVGVSNGGMMANRLACTNEKVKALVAVSGPLINGTASKKTESFECKRSIPMLHFHGDSDSVVPYYGCNKSTLNIECRSMAALPGFPALPWPSVPEAIADWRVRNGIPTDATGTTTFANASTECISWGESANNVTLCKVGGEGHAWPNSCSAASMIPGMHCSHDIDGSHHAMEFFRRYIAEASLIV